MQRRNWQTDFLQRRAPPGGGAELPVTCDAHDGGDDVRLTRGELDTLIDEAVRKDRARR